MLQIRLSIGCQISTTSCKWLKPPRSGRKTDPSVGCISNLVSSRYAPPNPPQRYTKMRGIRIKFRLLLSPPTENKRMSFLTCGDICIIFYNNTVHSLLVLPFLVEFMVVIINPPPCTKLKTSLLTQN